MKKTIISLFTVASLAACNTKTQVVYMQKPLIDTSILKAEFKGQEWNEKIGAVKILYIRAANSKDTSVLRKNFDTLNMVLSSIALNITDSTRNTIFKK